jgi:predicted transposase YbfD/YdcC
LQFLLKFIPDKGAIVLADVKHCQSKIASKIKEQGDDTFTGKG